MLVKEVDSPPIMVKGLGGHSSASKVYQISFTIGSWSFSISCIGTDRLPAQENCQILLGNNMIRGQMELIQSKALVSLLHTNESVPITYVLQEPMQCKTKKRYHISPLTFETVDMIPPKNLNFSSSTLDCYFSPVAIAPNVYAIPVAVNSSKLKTAIFNLNRQMIVVPANTVIGNLEVNVNFTISTEEFKPTRPSFKSGKAASGWTIDKDYIGEKNAAKVAKLLDINFDLFPSDDQTLSTIPREVGLTTIPTIDTVNPPAARPRPLSLAEREQVRKELEKMLKLGVIRPSNSPWSSPIVLVTKKDGSVRFCVDYRKLNGITIKDSYPMPRLEDLLNRLHGKKYFSVLDARSGYWQLPVAEEDIFKTAFITHEGLFEFVKQPFGISSGCAIWQRMLDRVLGDLRFNCCAVYIDDILVFSDSLEQHMKDLQNVFDRLRTGGIQLKASKCKLAMREVVYLAHLITPEGLKLEQAKVEALKKFTVFNNVHDVRRFLGMCNFYRRFVKDYAKITAPLNALLQVVSESKKARRRAKAAGVPASGDPPNGADATVEHELLELEPAVQGAYFKTKTRCPKDAVIFLLYGVKNKRRLSRRF
jgi:hypothetical protein